MTEMSKELAAVLASGRDVRIPILAPRPVTEEDVERLYSLTDEATLGSDAGGQFVEVVEDEAAVQRVMLALRQAGFRTIFDESHDQSQLARRIAELTSTMSELSARVDRLAGVEGSERR
jgi:hypothetical protein